MTDVATTAKKTASVATEVGKVVVTEAAITAAEVAASVAILATAGFVYSKWTAHRAKKAPVLTVVPE